MTKLVVPRGSLLLESILAVFLLLTGVIIFGGFFQRSAQMERNQERLAVQIELAENTMAEIRTWATEPRNYHSDWSAWNGRTITSSSHPEISATITCPGTGRELFSPCSELEANYSASTARKIAKAVVPVEILVEAPPLKPLSIFTQVSPPRSVLGNGVVLQVTRTSGTEPISRNGQATYRAELQDSSGNVIPGVTVQWFLTPQSGNGTLEVPERNGNRAIVHNYFRLPGGGVGFASGSVLVRARVRYHGQMVQNGVDPTTVVQLQ